MSTISPNMALPIPTAGDTSGPTYALQVNSSLTLIDQHDHTPGNGVRITPQGININSTLTMSNNFLTNIKGLTLSVQGSTPGINTIYESGVDLYFVDGNGNNVRITQSGGIAGSPGSIANLTSPASASYVSLSGTFVWQSDTTTAANLDAASVIIREQVANGKGVTLSAPTGLASNYTLTLMGALPASSKIMRVDNSGVMSSTLDVDNSTIEISSNNLQVKDSGIIAVKLATDAVETVKIKDHNVTKVKLANDTGYTISNYFTGTFSVGITSFQQLTTPLGAPVEVSITPTGRPVVIGICAIPATLGYFSCTGPVEIMIADPSNITTIYQTFRVGVANTNMLATPSQFFVITPNCAANTTYRFSTYIRTVNGPPDLIVAFNVGMYVYEL